MYFKPPYCIVKLFHIKILKENFYVGRHREFRPRYVINDKLLTVSFEIQAAVGGEGG